LKKPSEKNLQSAKQFLRQKVIATLLAQGFKVNPHIRPAGDEKEIFRRVQRQARLDKLQQHYNFLSTNQQLAKIYLRNGNQIDPEKIKLELREVKANSQEERLFLFWNLIWWSIPYERAYGRQIRFLVWDKTHDAPLGLIGLQSAPLKMSVRDTALGISKEERDWWVNQSMMAQRVGALPPYNELLGGKMVALALVAKDIRDVYRKKYGARHSIMKHRQLPADLLFVTTTGAFGKSSIYNRLKYDCDEIARFLGYTQGSGAFHIPEALYRELVDLVQNAGYDVSRGYGYGPSRKRQLLNIAFRLLDLRHFEYHGIQRAFYLISFIKNLEKVIQNGTQPVFKNYRLSELTAYWKERWALPRATRQMTWQNFNAALFMDEVQDTLNTLQPPS
jgi:hypothetical protein